MLRFAFAVLLLAAPTGAKSADWCDGLAAQIAQATGGGKVGKRTGPAIDIRSGSGVELDLTCRKEPIVQAISRDSSPSPAYFRDLTIASSIVLEEAEASVQQVVDSAYQLAASRGLKSFVQQRGWSASCYVDQGSAMRTLCSVSRIPPH